MRSLPTHEIRVNAMKRNDWETRRGPHEWGHYEQLQPPGGTLSRRRLLSIGGLGLLGLDLPKLYAAERRAGPPPRARSVIFLYQFGGPSHIDMFDMKPDAPEAIRGPHRPIASSVPGLNVCEYLPNVARVMDKVTLVRSVHHTMKNHN
ncbi:MAG: DUF1501 domain-containing protein, partial [Pirellulales bacterium]